METIVDSQNHEHLNKIRKYMIQEYLDDRKIDIRIYHMLGTDQMLLSFELDYTLTDDQMEYIHKILNSLKPTYSFLHKGCDLPIKQLKRMNKIYDETILNYKDIFFVDMYNIDNVFYEFGYEFIKKFDIDYEQVNMSDKEILSSLGLIGVGELPCTLEEKNDRLILNINDEEHHMDYEELSNYIFEKMKLNTDQLYYTIENDRENLDFMLKGNSPLTPYKDYEKFRLITSLIKLSKKENLPTYNCMDILKMCKNNNGFEYYNLEFKKKLEGLYNSYTYEDYKEFMAYTKEEAIIFCIYIGNLSIDFILMEEGETYTVGYLYGTLLNTIHKSTAKDLVIHNYTIYQKGRNYNAFNGEKFVDMKFSKLIHSFNVDGNILFYSDDHNHINPINKNPLPLEYYEAKDYSFNGIYTFINIEGVLNKVPIFDRSKLNLPEYNFYFDYEEGGIKRAIRDKLLLSDFSFNDKKKAISLVKNLWKKGFLSSSYSLMNYMNTGEIKNSIVTFPSWFTLENSSEEHLFKFISCLLEKYQS